MLTDWAALCSPQDPVLVVPWADADRHTAFVDLRRNPYEFDSIPEALRYPALLQALRALNATRSPVFTAKCDVWSVAADELRNLSLELGEEGEAARVGFAGYIDLVWRDTATFTSAAQQQQLISRLLRQAAALHHPGSMLECILRPAVVDLGSAQEGYAISLYVKALGHDEAAAVDSWGAALSDVVRIVRSREFSR